MGPNIGSRAQDVRIMVSMRLGRAITKREARKVDALRRAGIPVPEIAEQVRAEAQADANPHRLNAGTRLSSAYTAGRKGLPCPAYLRDRSSAGHQAWLRGTKDAETMHPCCDTRIGQEHLQACTAGRYSPGSDYHCP